MPFAASGVPAAFILYPLVNRSSPIEWRGAPARTLPAWLASHAGRSPAFKSSRELLPFPAALRVSPFVWRRLRR